MHNEKTSLYRLETTQPLAGRGEHLTLKDWKRIYGFPEMLCGRGRLVPVVSDWENGDSQWTN